MNPITMFGVTVLAAAFLFSPGSEALAQQPSSGDRISMFCSTSAGGPGFVLVTLSNLATSTVDRLAGLTTLQHRKVAFEQIGSIKARMCVKSRIHVRR